MSGRQKAAKTALPQSATHTWEFKAHFRRHAFTWKSQPAVTRVKEAVAEIAKVAKKDVALAAEGAVQLLERLSPALERVDSSSGAIGAAVNSAVAQLAPIIGRAPVDLPTREAWLERLWEAYLADEVPYIEQLGDLWGELCGSEAVASAWADRLIDTARQAWGPDPALRGYFKGTSVVLSALVAARRHHEVLALLELAPYKMWYYQQYGVKALVGLGKKAEALRYAEEGRSPNDSPVAIARACEEILLSSGLAEEAYRRYGLVANQGSTYVATFRAVAKKYPNKLPAEILADLVRTTPGQEGKWFAAAKSAGLYDEALDLAARTPCDPKTLARAAAQYAELRPDFAVRAGMLALHWLLQGHGYEITTADVWDAYFAINAAATRMGNAPAVKAAMRAMVAKPARDLFVMKVLGKELGL